MTVSHSAQMLLKLEKCIPISHVTLETVPKYANSSNVQRQANFMPVDLSAPSKHTHSHQFYPSKQDQ